MTKPAPAFARMLTCIVGLVVGPPLFACMISEGLHALKSKNKQERGRVS
jgi:hypothetical protein